MSGEVKLDLRREQLEIRLEIVILDIVIKIRKILILTLKKRKMQCLLAGESGVT